MRFILLVLSMAVLTTDTFQAQYSVIDGRKVSPMMLAREPRPMVPRNQVSPSGPALETCGPYLDRVIASDGKTPMIRYFFRLDNGQIVEEMFRLSNIRVEEQFRPYSIVNPNHNHPWIQQFIKNGTMVVHIRGNYRVVKDFHTCRR